jgi:hypothetical protein
MNTSPTQMTVPAARLTGDVYISILKMFHPPFNTAGTHAGNSIHIMKSFIDDSCQVSLFHEKFKDSTLTKLHFATSHFLATHDGNISCAHVQI